MLYFFIFPCCHTENVCASFKIMFFANSLSCRAQKSWSQRFYIYLFVAAHSHKQHHFCVGFPDNIKPNQGRDPVSALSNWNQWFCMCNEDISLQEVQEVPKNKKAELDPLGRFYSVKVTLYLAQFLLIS